MSAARTRAVALRSLSAGMAACALGCEIVEPADTGTDTSSSPTTGGGAPGTRPVSDACNYSPALLAGAPAQVNGAFCFGVALTSSEYLRCAQRDLTFTDCIDEVAGFAYVVRWAGSNGVILDATGARPLGSLSVVGRSTFEIATVRSPGTSPVAAGLCSFGVVDGVSVAEFCAYTN